MSTDLLERTFEGHQVRLVVVDDEPRVVVADVCAVLGLSNPTRVASRLDPDALTQAQVIDSLGRQQVATVVDEGGLYELVLRSDKPAARSFARWVTREVLPEIRRTGSFSLVPQTYAQALRAHADAVEAQEAAEQRALAAETAVGELAPKADAWESVADAEGDYSVRDAAQMLVRAGINTGERRLFTYLREIRWIDRQNRPYQDHVDRGQVVQRIRTYPHPRTGETQTTTQMRITPKGVERLIVLMRQEG